MLTIHTFASGSEGNCLLVSAGGVHLLVDAGISARRITAALRSLGLTPQDVAAVLVTHGHADHTAGIATLTKQYHLPLYATAAAALAIREKAPAAADVLHILPRRGVFWVGDVAVTVFPTSHDAPGSVDFRFDYGGAGAGILTDTGFVTPEAAEALRGASLVVLESNHDVDWLLSGPYPYYLKERILGECGHLSNEAAASFGRQLAESGTRQLVLAHLSRENNTPDRAREVMERAVDGLPVTVTVAPRCEVGCYTAEETVCSV